MYKSIKTECRSIQISIGKRGRDKDIVDALKYKRCLYRIENIIANNIKGLESLAGVYCNLNIESIEDEISAAIKSGGWSFIDYDGRNEWVQWVQAEKEQLATVMERYDIQWEQKGTHEKYLSVLDYKKQEREKEIAALDTTLAEKQDELETVQNRISNYNQGAQSIERLEQRIETDTEFQLPDPLALMTAKTYKQRFVDQLITKLKEVIREVFYRYYKALDSYHRLNNTNGRLYRENEHLTAVNDRLKGENDALRSELKDFRLLRKVLGSRQIDNLIAQAQEMNQQRKQTQRTRRRNTSFER
ncbi:MAG: hypothetical protein HFG67_04905 [Firmicutes bacterium]|nr:hypothetical protein [Bacillota bacterium]